MVSVGLTGGIGSGKSAVADLLAAKGAIIIDTDVLAREAVEPGTAAFGRIVQRFGPTVVDIDGRLDRRRLGEIVFADEVALRDLEAITHPAIRELAKRLADRASSAAVVVQVIPLLVEHDQLHRFDQIVVVDLDPDVQVARVQARDGHSVDHIRARMAVQAERSDRLAVADVVIDNSGSPQDLARQVDELWASLIVTQ